MTTPDIHSNPATAGGPGITPALPSGDADTALVSQLANALFAETATPGIGAGPSAPLAAATPSLGEGPFDAAGTVAPAIPGVGTTPPGVPPLGPPPVEAAPTTPGTVPGGLVANTVPAVGEGAFLRDLPFEADGGLPHFADQPAPAGTTLPAHSEWPTTDADLRPLGLEGLFAPVTAEPVAETSSFYFLPAPPALQASTDTPAAFDVHAVRRDFPALHQRVHGKPLVWLDNAATTHKPQAVIDALSHFYAHDNSNIHRGAHTLAERATIAYEDAREKVQRLLGARETAEIIFVRGATEAINLVAQSYGHSQVGPGDDVLVTQLEHHANIVPWQFLCQATGGQR